MTLADTVLANFDTHVRAAAAAKKPAKKAQSAPTPKPAPGSALMPPAAPVIGAVTAISWAAVTLKTLKDRNG